MKTWKDYVDYFAMLNQQSLAFCVMTNLPGAIDHNDSP